MQPDNFDSDEALIIGFAEDGILWVTESEDVTDAAGAERVLADWNGVWRAVAEVHVRPDLGPGGGPLGGGDESWMEGLADEPWARKAWRLVNVTQEETVFQGEDSEPNPHHDPEAEE